MVVITLHLTFNIVTLSWSSILSFYNNLMDIQFDHIFYFALWHLLKWQTSKSYHRRLYHDFLLLLRQHEVHCSLQVSGRLIPLAFLLFPKRQGGKSSLIYWFVWYREVMRDNCQHWCSKSFFVEPNLIKEVQFSYKLPSAYVNFRCASSTSPGGLLFIFSSTIVAFQESSFFINHFFIYATNSVIM